MTIDEIIAVLEAYKRGEKLEYSWDDGESWRECGIPSWGFANCKYRIAPDKPKKVKLLAWFEQDTGYINWRLESLGQPKHSDCIRVPAEDKEIELP